MILKRLFKELDKVYHAEGQIREDLDYGDGDTLALFIVNEIKSLTGHREGGPLRAEELGELCNAFDRALGELGDVVCELHAIHAKQSEKEKRKNG